MATTIGDTERVCTVGETGLLCGGAITGSVLSGAEAVGAGWAAVAARARQFGQSFSDGGTSEPHFSQIHVNMVSLLTVA